MPSITPMPPDGAGDGPWLLLALACLLLLGSVWVLWSRPRRPP